MGLRQSHKTELKPFLTFISSHAKFSPEIARRLGNPLFTKNLKINKSSLENFLDKPKEMLCEIINTMDDGNRAAIALVFLKGGILPSPLIVNDEEKYVIERLGGSVGTVTKSLESLNGSILLNSIKNGEHSWHFKHPTVQDAFASIVASSQDLTDIYLKGASLEKLFSEISCGDVGLEGTSVIVLKKQYYIILDKISSYNFASWSNKSILCRFLSYRCDSFFLVQFLERFPNFITKLYIGSYIRHSSDLDLVLRLNEFNLLPEEERMRFVSEIKELSVATPDSGFLREDIRTLMSDSEITDILGYVKDSLLPFLDNTIDDWRSDYDRNDDDPDYHFGELEGALEAYKEEFSEDDDACEEIAEAIEKISQIVEELTNCHRNDHEDDIFGNSSSAIKSDDVRSIFDDVDA